MVLLLVVAVDMVLLVKLLVVELALVVYVLVPVEEVVVVLVAVVPPDNPRSTARLMSSSKSGSTSLASPLT